MRIVLDAMGTDNFPTPDVEGAVMAAREYDVEVILVGDEQKVAPALAAHHANDLKISIVHAPEMLTMEDKGLALALKAKRKEPKTSVAVGIDLVKKGEAAAFVTMGNTGGTVAMAYFRLGTIEGVERPALAGPFPTKKGSCLVLDIGANPDVKPENIVQFAQMGTIYAERVRGVKNPVVGLLANGEEGGKGNQLTKDSYHALKESGLNFMGNLEPKMLLAGEADVAVTDGFTGNILLKTSEAVAKLILESVKEKIHNGSPLVKIGGLLVRPTLRSLRALLDPSEEGAAPLLGANGLVFIGHGSSNAVAIKNAIRVAKQAAEANILNSIRDEIARTLAKAN
ncbi:MAG: phosphate acyltransferase PlsX [Chloroflexi bacterium]|nr:phosphate acyltransferase PlsX [Chloroflexota bacterium]